MFFRRQSLVWLENLQSWKSSRMTWRATSLTSTKMTWRWVSTYISSIIKHLMTFLQGNPIDWMTKAMTQEQAPRPSGKGPKVSWVAGRKHGFRLNIFCSSGFYSVDNLVENSGLGKEPSPDHVPGTPSKGEVNFLQFYLPVIGDCFMWKSRAIFGNKSITNEFLRDWELKQEWASSRENRNASR